MVRAYILVKVEAGRDEEVHTEITKLPNIRNANACYGIYDLIIDVELPKIEELDAWVFEKMRKVPGVNETATIIISKVIV